uniref:hypothetical protein n=1 Tax=Roseivirga sp. TaxID=1964215 RepID=UPI004047E8DA
MTIEKKCVLYIFFIIVSCDNIKSSNEAYYGSKRFNIDRKYKEVSFSSFDSVEVLHSSFILELNDRRILINNWNEQKIQEYDHQLNLVFSYGGKGSGPDEFQSIINIALGRESFYCVDSELQVTKEFEYGNSIALKTIQFEDIIIDKSVELEDGILLACGQGLDKPFGFYLVSLEEKKILKEVSLEFNNNLNNSKHPSLIYDGNFSISSDGKSIIYFCNMYNRIFFFNREGELTSEMETIDNTPLPEFVSNDRIAAYKPGTRSSNSSVTFSKDLIYVLSRARDNAKQENRALDIYANSTKQYLYSIKLPDNHGSADRLIAFDNYFYVFYPDYGIVKMRINE